MLLPDVYRSTLCTNGGETAYGLACHGADCSALAFPLVRIPYASRRVCGWPPYRSQRVRGQSSPLSERRTSVPSPSGSGPSFRASGITRLRRDRDACLSASCSAQLPVRVRLDRVRESRTAGGALPPGRPAHSLVQRERFLTARESMNIRSAVTGISSAATFLSSESWPPVSGSLVTGSRP